MVWIAPIHPHSLPFSPVRSHWLRFALGIFFVSFFLSSGRKNIICLTHGEPYEESFSSWTVHPTETFFPLFSSPYSLCSEGGGGAGFIGMVISHLFSNNIWKERTATLRSLNVLISITRFRIHLPYSRPVKMLLERKNENIFRKL